MLDSRMKARRQAVILQTLERESVRSQEQLRRRLRAAGFDVTQATLSRDIRELGLVKGGPEGGYRSPAPTTVASVAQSSALQRALVEYQPRMTRVQQLIVINTGLGQAQALCVALDQAHLPEVVGTVAGEDTILVIAADARRAKALIRRLESVTAQRKAS
ncbi:MAG: arginine repressor [Vicinamibacterales bacterium]